MLYNMTISADKAGLQVLCFFSALVSSVFLIHQDLPMYIGTFFSLFQVAVHAIGDRANDLILDLYKSVTSENGVRDRRFRVKFNCYV